MWPSQPRKPLQVFCPCGRQAELVDASEVDPFRTGKVWLCRPCGAWVGTYHNSPDHKPLGRLDDAPTREAKYEARLRFTLLWKMGLDIEMRLKKDQRARDMRKRAYEWLAQQLDMPVSECSFDKFDLGKCVRVISICKQFIPGFIR